MTVPGPPQQESKEPIVGALGRHLPGLGLTVALAAVAVWLASTEFVDKRLHLSALLLVILLGMLVRSVVPLPEATTPGIRLAQRPILRWAVAGLGFKLSLGELIAIGAGPLVVVVVTTTGSLWFGWWFARRLGIGHKLGLLLGVGGAICGASAVVAADSVVQGERTDAAYSLGIITLLGTIGIVVYPVIAGWLDMTDFVYGVWNGASLHEMAQVVAAGYGVSERAAEVSTVVKLARICLLAPIVFYLAWNLRRHREATGEAKVSPVPWFLVLFVVFAAINSITWSFAGIDAETQKRVVEWAVRIDLWLLAIGMAGVGLQSGFRDLRGVGWRPVIVGVAQWAVLAVSAYALAAWLL
ncbi:MAG TPA: putative sulfate exporter family transporter [Fimbriimonadaceae bacterium]|nr:putative sulfate exporter family transporter [Fimbriimonadaceae bacterium]HRJ97408.1 putative sulfate exporter family transporter [Fimbriimonadaceae bacterium]